MWRLFTWPLANEPDIWTVITLAIFWYFGREIEGTARADAVRAPAAPAHGHPGHRRRRRSTSAQAGIAPVELAVFLVFIAEYPFARFFFGIPAWAIGAVFVGIEVLQFLGPATRRSGSSSCS